MKEKHLIHLLQIQHRSNQMFDELETLTQKMDVYTPDALQIILELLWPGYEEMDEFDQEGLYTYVDEDLYNKMVEHGTKEEIKEFLKILINEAKK